MQNNWTNVNGHRGTSFSEFGRLLDNGMLARYEVTP